MELSPGVAFTSSQDLLRRAARDFLAKECSLSVVRAAESDPAGCLQQLWRQVAELGWLGIPYPVQYGGGEGTFLDLAVLLDEMGRALFPGPLLWTTLCGLLVQRHGTEAQRQALLPGIAEGSKVATLAWPDRAGLFDADSLETRMGRWSGHMGLWGEKRFVPFGGTATHLLVVVRAAGGGPVVCIVPRDRSGITSRALATTGHDPQADVTLNGVPVSDADILGGDGAAVLEDALALGAAMQCMVLCGMAQRVLDMTVEYAKTRVQFGRPIGSLQAVQHHAANMALDTDISRALSYQLAQRIAEGKPFAVEAAAAKAFVSGACQRAIALGHQVHGGIGVITEHAMPLYFLRLKALDAQLGDTAFNLDRVGRRLESIAT